MTTHTQPDWNGRRVLIVHYGEHTPLDDGYRRARMGRVAAHLHTRGADVVRYVPTWSPFAGRQRPVEWSGTRTDEGRIEMIPTRAFQSSRSADRFRSLIDLAKGVRGAVAADEPFDVALIGLPPPGIATALRRGSPTRLPVVADVRDLWPDALVPDGHRVMSRFAGVAGRLLAQELRIVTAGTAMSSVMLRRVPKPRRTEPIPIGLAHGTAAPAADLGPQTGPLRAVFVGFYNQLFDMHSLIEGWGRFAASVADEDGPPSLTLVGGGERAGEVEALASRHPTIDFVGPVPSAEVPGHLVTADIGISPIREGQGTTFSNKVFEYLSAGLFVVQSLEPEISAELEAGGFGVHVPWTADAWTAAFAKASADRATLRSSRAGRIDAAASRYGHDGVMAAWERLLWSALTGERWRPELAIG